MKSKKTQNLSKKELFNKIGKPILKLILIFVVIAAIAVAGYFILRALGFTTTEKLVELRGNLGSNFLFWLVIGCLQIIQVIFIPLSNQIITVPLAVMFPANELWKVWLCSWLSIWIATMILYALGRWGGGKLLSWVLNDEEQVEKCKNFLKRGWLFYPLGMLLPLPDDIVTCLAGVARMNFFFVLGSSLLTRGIDTACSVFGFGLLTKYWWGWVLLAVGILLLIVATVVLFILDNKKKKSEENQNGKINRSI